MNMHSLLNELKLEKKALSIILTNDEIITDRPIGERYTLSLLKRAMDGETLCFDGKKLSCSGAKRGMGFYDGIPNIKGGKPRAVIGNVDALARAYFDANMFFFMIPARSFHEMLEDADTCFFQHLTGKASKKGCKY